MISLSLSLCMCVFLPEYIIISFTLQPKVCLLLRVSRGRVSRDKVRRGRVPRPPRRNLAKSAASGSVKVNVYPKQGCSVHNIITPVSEINVFRNESYEQCFLSVCLLPEQNVVDGNWFLDDAGGGKFQMMDGQTYKYQYVTKSETRVAGSSPSNTTLTMTASLAINVLTACEMELLVSSSLFPLVDMELLIMYSIVTQL